MNGARFSHNSSLDWAAFPYEEGRHYEVDGETGCFVWLMFLDRGYGRYAPHGIAHRYAYKCVYHVPDLPSDIDVHHMCGNRSCVNPEHMELKPRNQHRREHGAAKSPLSPGDVVTIRERAAAGEKITALAAEYGLNHWSISMMCRGLAFHDIAGPIFDGNLTCQCCGVEMTGLRTKKYCTPACRQRAGYHRRRAA